MRRLVLFLLPLCVCISSDRATTSKSASKNAITCEWSWYTHDKFYSISQYGGDFYTVSWSSDSEWPTTVCRKGMLFAGLVNQCESDRGKTVCTYDSKFCPERYVKPQPKEVKLRCLRDNATELFTACKGVHYLKSADGNGSFDYSSTPLVKNYLQDLIRPQSCVRLQTDVTDRVVCMCDTGDYCAERMLKEQRLVSRKVTCYMSSKTGSGKNTTDTSKLNRTCTGDFCYLEYSPSYTDKLGKGRFRARGCITNNATFASDLYRAGTLRGSYDNQYDSIICDSSFCNKNWNSAARSIPASPATTDTVIITAYQVVGKNMSDVICNKTSAES